MRCLIALLLVYLLAAVVTGKGFEDEFNINYSARKVHFDKINKVICYSRPNYGKCTGRRQLWFFNKYKSNCEKLKRRRNGCKRKSCISST